MDRDMILTFSLENDYYGLNIDYVTEIIGMQNISFVPDLENHIEGVINLRGKIIPIMDLRVRFGIEKVPYHDRTCIVVIETNDDNLGIIVDKVYEVAQVSYEDMAEIPEVGRSKSKYIEKIGKINEDITLIIDIDCVLGNEEVGA